MDANTREAMELRMTAGSEMETAGVTGKSKEMVGSEAEMVSGTESGADTEVGMDSKLTVDRSGGRSEHKMRDRDHRSGHVIDGGGYHYQRWCGGGGMDGGMYDFGNNSVSVCGNERICSGRECVAQKRRNRNGAGRVIRGVYRLRMNSVCMCGSEQGLGAGKCAAWNCQNGNGAGGGSGVFSGGCTFRHESGNAYGDRGSECEYGDIGSFGGAAIRMEN